MTEKRYSMVFTESELKALRDVVSAFAHSPRIVRNCVLGQEPVEFGNMVRGRAAGEMMDIVRHVAQQPGDWGKAARTVLNEMKNGPGPRDDTRDEPPAERSPFAPPDPAAGKDARRERMDRFVEAGLAGFLSNPEGPDHTQWGDFAKEMAEIADELCSAIDRRIDELN